jgi:hypothetical protein
MKKSLHVLAAIGLALSCGAASAAGKPRFLDSGSQTVLDSKTKLEWTASDGGLELTWRDQQARCAALGQGWRLPTAPELKALRDPKLASPCGPGTCTVAPLFRLSEVLFWTSTQDNPDDATLVNLADGSELSILNGPAHHFRALCVAPQKREREGKPLKHP